MLCVKCVISIRYLPFCRGHLDCAWLYLTAVCACALALALCLAVCCVHCSECCCCCCCRRKKGGSPISAGGSRRRASIKMDEGIPFDCLVYGDLMNVFSKKKYLPDALLHLL